MTPQAELPDPASRLNTQEPVNERPQHWIPLVAGVIHSEDGSLQRKAYISQGPPPHCRNGCLLSDARSIREAEHWQTWEIAKPYGGPSM